MCLSMTLDTLFFYNALVCSITVEHAVMPNDSSVVEQTLPSEVIYGKTTAESKLPNILTLEETTLLKLILDLQSFNFNSVFLSKKR